MRDLLDWVRGDGLEIVLVVLGLLLATRAVASVGRLVTGRLNVGGPEAGEGEVDRAERAKHRQSVAQVLIWTVNVLMFCIAAVRIVNLLGFSITGLVAPAAVLGVALGFGAQRVVQDLLAGFFIITERQYGLGDVIRISDMGSPTGVSGTVEEISLRITRLRSAEGELIMIPNGQLVQVTNLSRDWARAVVDIAVPPTADIGEALRVIRETCVAAFADDRMRGLLTEAPVVVGVDKVTVSQVTIRIWAPTKPGSQWETGRALRGRILVALHREGINMRTEYLPMQDPMGAQP
ncbi:MAG: mechanosensitive ion channel family protein [Sporichthyaceae bacterium]|jgi:small-conductance mechanosensitive channel